ncbi:MAG TPA: DNA repair protein RecO [Firmicutes bacterium]|nr:DNA repair protein RecO [Bacillota bacterium]
MALYRVEGIVVRNRDNGEADRLITVFTREEGKLAAIAKGCRRPGSRLAAAVQPFACSRLQLWRGKHLDVVTQGQLRESFPHLRANLPALASASLAAELVDAFTQERDPAPALYALLRGTLATLDEVAVTSPGQPAEAVVYAFTLGLLALAGYAPSLDRCVYCGQKADPSVVIFDAEAGGMVCGRCGPPEELRGWRVVRLTPVARQVLSHLAGLSPQTAARLQVSPTIMAEVRLAVLHCLEVRLERRPRAWDFWTEQCPHTEDRLSRD